MSAWLTIPSARPVTDVNACTDEWRRMGYKIALWRDRMDDVKADFTMAAMYPGYSVAVNALIAEVMEKDPEADWMVTGGDDVSPDLNHTAEEIAEECSHQFMQRDIQKKRWDATPFPDPRTFGVMQPTGDRWGDKNGAYIDRVAGSAWIGREFCRRAYGGKGPMWHEYFHMFNDQELQEVAIKLGVFWQRPDLIQLHRHWGRGPENGIGSAAKMPEFLRTANGPDNWRRMKGIFEARKAAGFPGSEVIA